MIVIETKFKKFPEKCNKCKYSYIGAKGERFCSVSFNKNMCRPCPIDFVAEKRNWEYQRPEWCPLKEVQS